jgi:hypothetical protein
MAMQNYFDDESLYVILMKIGIRNILLQKASSNANPSKTPLIAGHVPVFLLT